MHHIMHPPMAVKIPCSSKRRPAIFQFKLLQGSGKAVCAQLLTKNARNPGDHWGATHFPLGHKEAPAFLFSLLSFCVSYVPSVFLDLSSVIAFFFIFIFFCHFEIKSCALLIFLRINIIIVLRLCVRCRWSTPLL